MTENVWAELSIVLGRKIIAETTGLHVSSVRRYVDGIVLPYPEYEARAKVLLKIVRSLNNC